jgi:hypothetical protein
MSDTNALHSRTSSPDLAHFRQDTILQEAALMPIDREQEQMVVVYGMQGNLHCATIGRTFVVQRFLIDTEPVLHA